jgi:uncharacterized metal-binding protein YceD (DUF177 family)
MRHKIKDIAPEGSDFSGAIEGEILDEAFRGTEAERARSSGEVSYQLLRSGGDEVLLHGRMKATLGLACDRCLGATAALVEAPLDVVFRREGELAEEEVEGDLDEADYAEHDGTWVDVGPFLREQLLLAIPMTHLCKADCKGLCATCGQDLNAADCGHRPVGEASALAEQLAHWKQTHKQ